MHQRKAAQTLELISLHFHLQQHLQALVYSVALNSNCLSQAPWHSWKLLSFSPFSQVPFLLPSVPLPRPLRNWQMSQLRNSTDCPAALDELPFSPGFWPSCPGCFSSSPIFQTWSFVLSLSMFPAYSRQEVWSSTCSFASVGNGTPPSKFLRSTYMIHLCIEQQEGTWVKYKTKVVRKIRVLKI